MCTMGKSNYLFRKKVFIDMTAKYTEAQARSIKKYLKSQYQFKVTVPVERKEEIQNAAAAVGESVNAYVVEAINRRIESGT